MYNNKVNNDNKTLGEAREADEADTCSSLT
jgi:hypothetical protein